MPRKSAKRKYDCNRITITDQLKQMAQLPLLLKNGHMPVEDTLKSKSLEKLGSLGDFYSAANKTFGGYLKQLKKLWINIGFHRQKYDYAANYFATDLAFFRSFKEAFEQCRLKSTEQQKDELMAMCNWYETASAEGPSAYEKFPSLTGVLKLTRKPKKVPFSEITSTQQEIRSILPGSDESVPPIRLAAEPWWKCPKVIIISGPPEKIDFMTSLFELKKLMTAIEEFNISLEISLVCPFTTSRLKTPLLLKKCLSRHPHKTFDENSYQMSKAKRCPICGTGSVESAESPLMWVELQNMLLVHPKILTDQTLTCIPIILEQVLEAIDSKSIEPLVRKSNTQQISITPRIVKRVIQKDADMIVID